MAEEKPVYCSFCGKPQNDVSVELMIKAFDAAICDRCVDVCRDIIGARRQPSYADLDKSEESVMSSPVSGARYDDDSSVGARLKAIRKKEGLTQQEFAESLMVSFSAYKNYEKGVRDVTEGLILALHKEFDVDPLWLLTGKTGRSPR